MHKRDSLVACVVLFMAAAPAVAQSDQQQDRLTREILSLPWVDTGQAAVTSVATMTASNAAQIVSGSGADKFIELSGNLPHPGASVVAPKDLHWFSVYEYSDVGYVSDKDEVNPDDLMKALKDQEPLSNQERVKLGLDELHIAGWAVKPHYDVATHNLEWALRVQSSRGDSEVINYTTRHLGRGGYVASTLVTSPDAFQKDLAEFRASDRTLQFDSGNSYAEFRNGDKVAGYGLAALVAGGAGAAVVKSGAGKGIIAAALLAIKGFAKAIIIGFLALVAAAGKFMSRLFGRDKAEDTAEG